MIGQPGASSHNSRKSDVLRRRTFLPFHQPWTDHSEIQEVAETRGSGWPAKILQFETAFARYVGTRHAVSVTSCIAGLGLALDVIGLRPGDEVITSVYTSAATTAVALHLKARPVLVDVNPNTLTMDPAQVEQKITDRTRAVVPVHLAGLPCEMDDILGLAARHNLKVIEDAAHALPSRYKGRMVGSIGDLTVFTFDAVDAPPTAEGGIVTTDRDDYAEQLRTRRLHAIGIDPDSRRASHYDVRAALGVQQLRKADMFHAIRSYHAGLYSLGLSDLPELTLPETPSTDTQHAWHLYIVRLDPERLTIDRDAFVRLLLEENIGTRVHCIPLHLHPYCRDALGYRRDDFPQALQAYQQAICLPLYPRMSEADVWDVIGAVRRIVERHRVRRQL